MAPRMADAAASAARPHGVPAGLWVLAPLAVIAVLFVYPFSLILGEALTGGQGALSPAFFAKVFATNAFKAAFLHTLQISIAASAGCLIVGFIIALVLTFVPFPGSRTVARLIETFIALPTFLAALAFTFLYGSAGVLN